jgi:DivIVA domain-containing protein
MPFMPEDIAVKRFLVRARGYDRDEVAAFLRAVAADYRQALDALEGTTSETDTIPVTEAASEAAIQRAAELLQQASRRLEEVAARERQLVETERRVAHQLETVRGALQAARRHVRTAAVADALQAVPA